MLMRFTYCIYYVAAREFTLGASAYYVITISLHLDSIARFLGYGALVPTFIGGGFLLPKSKEQTPYFLRNRFNIQLDQFQFDDCLRPWLLSHHPGY